MTTSAPATGSGKTTEKQKSSFGSRQEYLDFLQSRRKAKGEEWYQTKLREMHQRDESKEKNRSAKRLESEAAWQLWWQKIDAWSASGGFEQVVSRLPLGEFSKASRTRFNYRVNGVKFEIDTHKQVCCRWDGVKFENGKKGASGAYGLAKCFLELQGSANASKEAIELVTVVSGIQREDVTITPDLEKKLAAMRVQQEAAAKERAEAEKREDPMTPEQLEEVPRRITDPKAIEELTELMARERGFPLEFAKRLQAEGLVWFGTYKYRDKESGKIVDSRRAIVCSDVKGFETGTLVGHSSREFREFYKGEAKGKNLGALTKGSVVIGNWSDTTKKVSLTEGVYDAAALVLMRERRNRPLDKDEAVLVMAGSRMPERLLQLIKQRGAKLNLAFDNDLAGRKLAAPILEWCKANGVECERTLPTRGEYTLELSDDAWGRAAYMEFAAKLSAQEIRFQFLSADRGFNRMVVETNDVTCEMLDELHLREVHSRTENKDVVRLRSNFHRKDWNELAQKPYAPRAITTAGLPAADDVLKDQFNDYLGRLGLQPEATAALRQSLLVYPAIVAGEPSAVWSAVDPRTGAALGFRAEKLSESDGKSVAAGASWHVGFSLGSPKSSTTLAIAATPESAVRSWLKGGKDVYTVLALDGVNPPASAVEIAKANKMFVGPTADGDEVDYSRAGHVAMWAKSNGLSYRAPETPAPRGKSGFSISGP